MEESHRCSRRGSGGARDAEDPVHRNIHEETELSKNGNGFKGPGGEHIKNYGKQASDLLKDSFVRKSTWQVADVRRPIVSASHIIQAGNDLFIGKDCDQLTVTSGCCTRVTSTMTANWTESKSPSFQLADNLCEAPFTDPRVKTSFTEDSLSHKQNTDYTHYQQDRGRQQSFIRISDISIHHDMSEDNTILPEYHCEFVTRQNLFCLMTVPPTIPNNFPSLSKYDVKQLPTCMNESMLMIAV